MQIFQTRQILAIIEAKFSRENSIFSVTQHGKTKTDPQFAGLVLLLCRTKCKFIVSETSSLSSFWNYCKRVIYIDFSFSEGVTRYRFKGQTTGPPCRSDLKFSSWF